MKNTKILSPLPLKPLPSGVFGLLQASIRYPGQARRLKQLVQEIERAGNPIRLDEQFLLMNQKA